MVNKGKTGRKNRDEAVFKRRTLIWRGYVAGIPVRELATHPDINISVGQVYKDIENYKADNRDVEYVKDEIRNRYKEIYRKAMANERRVVLPENTGHLLGVAADVLAKHAKLEGLDTMTIKLDQLEEVVGGVVDAVRGVVKRKLIDNPKLGQEIMDDISRELKAISVKKS